MLYEQNNLSISGPASENISLRSAKDWLEENYVSDSVMIYKGIHSLLDDFSFSKKNSFVRKSRNTYNYYTTLIDNLDSWKNYPKRSRSLVCTHSDSTAFEYGNVYVIVPKVGTAIGICPQSDIWYSFDKFLNYIELSKRCGDFSINMSSFCNFIRRHLDYHGLDYHNLDYNTLLKILVNVINTNGKDMKEFLNIYMSPEYNEFQLLNYPYKYDEINGNRKGNREVWFNEDSLLISLDAFHDYENGRL
jgi:hypothetical protein